MKVMGFIMVNSPCLFLQVVGVSIVSTPLESSRFFTSLGFLNLNNFGRCSGKRFASSKYVILIVLTDLHPYWLTDVEHPSFEMRPPLSSLTTFTFLWFKWSRDRLLILLFTPHFSWPLQALHRWLIGNRWSQNCGSSKTEANQGPILGCQVCWIFLYHFHYSFYR